MRVICFILCLIILTSVPAYADAVLWSTKHSSTNLAKIEEWLLWSTTEAGEDIEEAIEDIASDIEESEEDPEEDSEEFIEIIDPLIVVEGAEVTPLEILMDSSTPDEIQEYAIPEEDME